jgi:predicted GNAT family acetyltransferase
MAAALDIKREEFADGRGGRYWLRLPEGEAVLIYRWQDDDLVSADRTFTPPEARGKGVGAALVSRLVEDARREGFKIRPTCPYAALWFDRHPEAQDLRAP